MKAHIKIIYLFLLIILTVSCGCRKLKGRNEIDIMRRNIMEWAEYYHDSIEMEIEKSGKSPCFMQYAEKRYRETAKFLNGKDTLEKPYVVLAYLGFYGIRKEEFGGKKCLEIQWIEIGFNSIGARLNCKRDGEIEMLDFPHPEYSDETKRKIMKELPIRHHQYFFDVGSEWSIDIAKQYNYTVTAPEYIFSDDVEVYVTIYDKDGNESEPLELHIQKELKEDITGQNSTDPNL